MRYRCLMLLCLVVGSGPAWAGGGQSNISTNPTATANPVITTNPTATARSGALAASSSHATGGSASVVINTVARRSGAGMGGDGAGGGPGGGAGRGGGGAAGRGANGSNRSNGSNGSTGQSAGEGGGGQGPSWTAGRPVASAIAPAILNTNPCLPGATSAALQTGVFGFSFGASPGYDEACRLHQLGQDDVAVAYLCRSNGDIRQAFKDVGRVCPQDRPVAVVANVSPLPPPAPIASPPSRPSWCYTASRGELARHPECQSDRTS